MNIPTISLKTAPIQFNNSNFTTYTTQLPEPNLLRQSMVLQEGREEKANQIRDLIDASIVKARDSLNVAEHDWLNKQADKIRTEIDNQLELGNWQSAIRLGQQQARDLARNTELQDKIKTNEIYTAERNKIQVGNYNSYTKRRWDDVNKYYFNGAAEWNAKFKPVADMSIADVWALAVSRTPTRQESTSSSKTRNSNTFVNNAGTLITKPTETYEEGDNKITNVADGIIGTYSSTTNSSGGGSSYQEKREEDMIAMFQDLLKDENIRGALRQQFDNMNWLHEHANKVLSDPNATEDDIKQAKADLDVAKSSLSNKEGFMYVEEDESFDAWLQAQASQYAKDSAYRHTSTNSTSSITTSYGDSAIAAVAANRNKQALNEWSPGHAQAQGPNLTVNGILMPSSHNVEYVEQLCTPITPQ